MIERFEPTDAHDRRLVPGLGGLLGAFNAAGVLAAADVHTALRLGELVDEDDERLRLGVALAVRAARHGSVCVDLTCLADGDDLPVARLQPEPELPAPVLVHLELACHRASPARSTTAGRCGWARTSAQMTL